MQDLRYAVRSLRRQPLFTAVALLTLAVGIGANTAIFSVLYQTLLRPLPYADPDRLVFIWNSYPKGGLPEASVSIPDYLDRKTGAPALADATLFTQRSVSLADTGSPEQVRALRVTPSFFSTLGRGPALGRAFTDSDAQPGADRFAILTSGLWRTRFAADPGVVGRDVRIDGLGYRIVGVLPADFDLPVRDIALLVPFAFTPDDVSDSSRGAEFSSMIGRLAPGATTEQLEAQMSAIIRQVLDRVPQRRASAEASGFTGIAVPIREQLVGDLRVPLLILQAGVALVLLIACVNVANLLLMRATGRFREVAVRTAIGASRRHVIKQMVVEGLVLAAAGAVLGLAAGVAGVRGLVAVAGAALPPATSATLHPVMAAVAVGLATVTGLIFGLVPAVATLGTDINDALREDSQRGSAARGTAVVRSGLVVAEIALAMMLLVGAGLLIRSLSNLRGVDPGFRPDGVLTAQITLPATRYADAAARRGFWMRLTDAARALPGVAAAGVTSSVPFNGMVSSGTYYIEGYTPPPGQDAPHGRQDVVDGGYFQAMRIPLLRGRTFDASDGPDRPGVVVVDQYLVDRYFRDRDPIGQQIRRFGQNAPPMTIIGVVGTVNSVDLGEPVTKEYVYAAASQVPLRSFALVLRTSVPPESVVPQVRAAVQAIDPELPLADVRTMDQWLERSLQTRRAPALLLGIFGAIALLLAGIGIYGVVAFGVVQRRREFGIRQALGADGGTISGMVLRQGAGTAAIGIAIGTAGTLALTQYLQSQLYGIGARDATVVTAVALLLFVAALIACYLPARASSKVDPLVALRDS
jgi:predicted permease